MHLSATNSKRKYETFLSAQRMNCLFFIEGHTPCRMDETIWICLQKIRHEVWRFGKLIFSESSLNAVRLSPIDAIK